MTALLPPPASGKEAVNRELIPAYSRPHCLPRTAIYTIHKWVSGCGAFAIGVSSPVEWMRGSTGVTGSTPR